MSPSLRSVSICALMSIMGGRPRRSLFSRSTRGSVLLARFANSWLTNQPIIALFSGFALAASWYDTVLSSLSCTLDRPSRWPMAWRDAGRVRPALSRVPSSPQRFGLQAQVASDRHESTRRWVRPTSKRLSRHRTAPGSLSPVRGGSPRRPRCVGLLRQAALSAVVNVLVGQHPPAAVEVDDHRERALLSGVYVRIDRLLRGPGVSLSTLFMPGTS